MDVKVIVATHKKYRMPKDPMYLPIQVGAQNKEEIGYKPDNTGDNISVKKPAVLRAYRTLLGLEKSKM